MMRKASILLSTLLTGILVCAPVLGQAPAPQPAKPGGPAGQPQPKPAGQPGTASPQPQTGQAQNPDKPAPVEHNAPAAQYALALIATLGLLVIVCMPSRKR